MHRILRWPPAFAWGQVGSALLVGLTAGLVVGDLNGILIFAGAMAGGALVSVLAGWAWPGLAGPWWKLWLVGVFANPLFLAALVWMWVDRECLIEDKHGWDCMFADGGPDLATVCLGTPLLGLAARYATRRWRGRGGSG